jgi:hypothetical protein
LIGENTKDFIEQYKLLMLKANRYLDGMYDLQEEFDTELDLGCIERSYWVDALVVDNNELHIQVYRSGYEWGNADLLISMPECVDTKLLELRKQCEAIKTERDIVREALEKQQLQRQEELEYQNFLKLKAKFGG